MSARQGAAESTPDPGAAHEKPSWQRFLESSGGTALITVVLGGIVGSIITAMVQVGLKDREFHQAWLKTREEQALATYRQYSEGQLSTVTRTYEVIGRMIVASENLIALSEPAFDVSSIREADRPRVQKQRDTIRHDYNASDAEWRKNRAVLGLLLTYYHRNDPNVTRSWRGVQEAGDAFAACARKWSLDHIAPEDTRTACATEEKALYGALDALNAAFEGNRHYLWEGWESPEAMKQQTYALSGTPVR